MSLFSLFFDFNGRIRRSQYWLATFVLSVLSGMVMLANANLASPAAMKTHDVGTLLAGSVAGLIASCVLLWCGLAVQVKRFHDRGQSGWLAALPMIALTTGVATFISEVMTDQSFGHMVAAVIPHVIAFWAINIFFFINLGCLQGTDGPNKYGEGPGLPPPPRAGKSPASPSGSPVGAASFMSAEQAMERAIAQQALRPATANAAPMRPSAPMRSAAPASPLRPASPGGTPSFGRKR